MLHIFSIFTVIKEGGNVFNYLQIILILYLSEMPRDLHVYNIMGFFFKCVTKYR